MGGRDYVVVWQKVGSRRQRHGVHKTEINAVSPRQARREFMRGSFLRRREDVKIILIRRRIAA